MLYELLHIDLPYRILLYSLISTVNAVEMGMFKIFLIFEAENQRSREAEKLGKSRSREAEKQRKQI